MVYGMIARCTSPSLNLKLHNILRGGKVIVTFGNSHVLDCGFADIAHTTRRGQ